MFTDRLSLHPFPFQGEKECIEEDLIAMILYREIFCLHEQQRMQRNAHKNMKSFSQMIPCRTCIY